MKHLLSLMVILAFNLNAYGDNAACVKELKSLKAQAEKIVKPILKKNPVCKDAFYDGSLAAAQSAKDCPADVWKKIESQLKSKADLFDQTCMSDACIDSPNCMDVIDMRALTEKGFNGGIDLKKIDYQYSTPVQSLKDIPAVQI